MHTMFQSLLHAVFGLLCVGVNIDLLRAENCTGSWFPLYKNSCYKLNGNTITWGEARIECISVGGHLAILENAVEEKAIIAFMKQKYQYNNVWLDGTDVAREGNWYWATTGRTIVYTNWHSGEPNSQYRENCILFGHDTGYQWRSWSCDDLRTFLCEKDIA